MRKLKDLLLKANLRKANHLKALSLIALISLTALLVGRILTVRAEASGVVYENSESGYSAVIEDDADLLTEEEEQNLIEYMTPVTQYGYCIFKTIDSNSGSTYSYGANYLYSTIGNASCALFLIDMDNRELYVITNGRIRETVTDTKSEVITDNVYTYASNKDYYTCAKRVFMQVNDLMEGNRISQPMKYICNAIFAVLAALVLNFLIVYSASRMKKTGDTALLEVAEKQFVMGQARTLLTGTTKRYDPPSSSSSGGGGGGGGHSGGGGGGGFSGGGGGHKF